jgi:hypothetical protein
MTKTLDVCHLRADLGSFAVFLHLLGGEINHEEHEGHGEFRFVLRTAGRLRSGERGLLARSARQLAEHKIPSASCRRLQASCLRSPEKRMRTPREKQPLFTITPRIIVEDALLITCVGIALRELRARRDTSC